jgi:hypothetical protein
MGHVEWNVYFDILSRFVWNIYNSKQKISKDFIIFVYLFYTWRLWNVILN